MLTFQFNISLVHRYINMLQLKCNTMLAYNKACIFLWNSFKHFFYFHWRKILARTRRLSTSLKRKKGEGSFSLVPFSLHYGTFFTVGNIMIWKCAVLEPASLSFFSCLIIIIILYRKGTFAYMWIFAHIDRLTYKYQTVKQYATSCNHPLLLARRISKSVDRIQSLIASRIAGIDPLTCYLRFSILRPLTIFIVIFARIYLYLNSIWVIRFK